jgi:hypothetical protein
VKRAAPNNLNCYAHRDDGKRYVICADEKLTAFLELESAVRTGGELPRQAGENFPKLPGS